MAKKIQKPNKYAFIDSQNLNLGVRDQGWKLDFRRFRVYLWRKIRRGFATEGFKPPVATKGVSSFGILFSFFTPD